MLVDSSPLIYLAQLDALDVFEIARYEPLITADVERETSLPALAYDHPDSVVIAEAIRTGLLRRIELTADENQIRQRLQQHASGISSTDAGVLAAAQARAVPVLVHERRSARLALALGLEVWRPVELIHAGTSDPGLLRQRVLAFARLVNIPFAELEEALKRMEELR